MNENWYGRNVFPCAREERTVTIGMKIAVYNRGITFSKNEIIVYSFSNGNLNGETPCSPLGKPSVGQCKPTETCVLVSSSGRMLKSLEYCGAVLPLSSEMF